MQCPRRRWPLSQPGPSGQPGPFRTARPQGGSEQGLTAAVAALFLQPQPLGLGLGEGDLAARRRVEEGEAAVRVRHGHARHAVESARAMVLAMRALHPQFRARGWPELNIGVGISSGAMNVGNMGSRFRMAYTVLGDTVNLGSRLEGLTKQYGVDIIVSAATAAAERQRVGCQRLGVSARADGGRRRRAQHDPSA